MTDGGWGAVAIGLIRRPRLWRAAVRAGRQLAPDRWWATAPFLPLPPREYRRLRSLTQYGEPTAVPTPDDVVSWLQWNSSLAAIRVATVPPVHAIHTRRR